MRGVKLEQKVIEEIISLRQKGHTISEIKKFTGKGNAIVSKYIKGVEIFPEYIKLWEIKQRGSKETSEKDWAEAKKLAPSLIKNIRNKEKILILSSLYWGEGSKNDFGLSNTDPDLIKVFIDGLKELGITKDRLRITIRLYEDINQKKAISYWAKIIGIPKKQILNVNILKGKKRGKLKYGMCRVRITKGGKCLKLVKSIIELIKLSPHSSMDRTRIS